MKQDEAINIVSNEITKLLRGFGPEEALIQNSDNSVLNMIDSSESMSSGLPLLFLSHNGQLELNGLSDPLSDHPSPILEIEYAGLPEEDLLKSFQFSLVGGVIAAPDAAKFAEAHTLFKEFMIATTQANKEKEPLDNPQLREKISEAFEAARPQTDLHLFLAGLIDGNAFNTSAFTSSMIVLPSQSSALVQNFRVSFLPILEIASCSRYLVYGTILRTFSRTNTANTTKTGTDHPMNCAVIGILLRIQDLRKHALDNQDTVALFYKLLKLMIENRTYLHRSEEIVEVMTTCLLLFFFQLLTSPPAECKSTLHTMLVLAKSFGMEAFFKSEALQRINDTVSEIFWTLVRLDLYFLLLLDEPPLMASLSYAGCCDLNKARDVFLRNFENEELFADNYANYMCYLAARGLELVYSEKDSSYSEKWEELKAELARWHTNRPVDLKSVLSNNHIDNSNHAKVEIDQETLEIKYPLILYALAGLTFVNSLYHTVQVKMLQHLRMNNYLPLVEESRLSNMALNAAKVVGICLNDVHSGSMSWGLGFQYVASLVLTQGAGTKQCGVLYYYDSKKVMKKLLKNEVRNRWPVQWKFRDF